MSKNTAPKRLTCPIIPLLNGNATTNYKIAEWMAACINSTHQLFCAYDYGGRNRTSRRATRSAGLRPAGFVGQRALPRSSEAANGGRRGGRQAGFSVR